MSTAVEPLPGLGQVNEQGHAGYILVFNPKGIGYVKYNDIVQALVDHGFHPDKAVRTTPREAFGRWLETMRKSRAIDRLPNPNKQSSTAIFQFTKKALEGGRFQYAHELQIYLDTATGEVFCPDNKGLGDYAAGLVKDFMEEKAGDYINTLVKSLVDEATTMNALNLSPRAYSFSADNESLATRLCAFLEKIGVQCRFFCLAREPRTEDSLAQVALEKATKLMDALDERVDKWDGDTTPKSLSNQAERFAKAKREVEAHAALFRSLYEEMRERMRLSANKMLEKARECGLFRTNEPQKTVG